MTFHEFYNTNGTIGPISLTNWNVRNSDNYEFVIKVNSIPSTWPAILGVGNTNMYYGFNYYSNRSSINAWRAGSYSGDAYYYTAGARDFTKYIKVTVIDGIVTYYSGSDYNDISTVDSQAALGAVNATEIGNPYLFVNNNNNAPNFNFYYLKVYREGDTIHHYVSTDEGICDLVDSSVFPYTATDYILGPEVSPPTPPARFFNITLYRNYSEKNRVGKNLEEVVTLSGTLKDECSIIDPVIIIEADPVQIGGTNYLYIPVFGRYYFIQNFVIVRTNLIRLECHVDVLESFADGIKACSAIISKQENLWNLYINDGTFKTYQNPMVLTKPFPQGFGTWEFVLGVAGSDIQNQPTQGGSTT